MKYWLIIQNNIKKSKFTTFTLILLVALATALLITSIQTFSRMDTQVTQVNEECNGADVFIMEPNVQVEAVRDTLKSMNVKTSIQEERVRYYGDSFIKREGQKKEIASPIIVQQLEKSREISSIQLFEKSEKKHNNGVYVSGYLRFAEGLALGDKLVIRLDSVKYEAVIDGFYQDVMFPCPSCITMYAIYARKDLYQEIDNKGTPMSDFTVWKIQCPEKYEASYESKFIRLFNEKKALGLSNGVTFSYTDMEMGVKMFPGILMAILLGFSAILMVVVIVVIRFEITTYIQQNYKNLGVMEAGGYTSLNLIGAMVGQFSFIALVGVIVGIALTGVAGNAINNLLSVITGLQWTSPQQFLILGGVVLGMVMFVALITLVSSRKLRKISVLMALRDGINTHNFKRNYCALEHSRLPLNLSLGIKNIMTNQKQNICILMIAAILTFAISFSMTAFTNFTGESKSMRTFIGIESGDVMGYYNDDVTRDKVHSMKEVKRATNTVSIVLTLQSGKREESLSVNVRDDFSESNQDMVLEGRYPKHDNEICVTKVIAQQLKVELNDMLTIRNNDKEDEYLVVGITQQLSNMGRSASITFEAAQKVAPEIRMAGSMIILKDNTNIEKFIKRAIDLYGKENLSLSNMKKMLDDVMKSYEYSMKMLCIGSIIITCIVITLVMFLLVSIKILKERRNMGVNKALGFTTGQLMIQMIVGFVPSVAVGCTIGIVMGYFLTNPVTALFVSTVGISKCTFIVPVGPIILISISIVLLALLISVATSLRIRKITPSRLVSE